MCNNYMLFMYLQLMLFTSDVWKDMKWNLDLVYLHYVFKTILSISIHQFQSSPFIKLFYSPVCLSIVLGVMDKIEEVIL